MNIYFTDSARGSRYEEPVAPEKVYFVGDICSDRSSYFRLVDTLRRNASPTPHSVPVADHEIPSFCSAYRRILRENLPHISQFVSNNYEVTLEDAAGKYGAWNVQVTVGRPVPGVYEHMQPTLYKQYEGILGRHGLTIMLENGKSLLLRDGEFECVYVVSPCVPNRGSRTSFDW